MAHINILFLGMTLAAFVSANSTLEPCWPACPSPDALLAHPRDCAKYYQCAFSVPYEKICPAGLYFSVGQAVCDYPELAQCTSTEDAPCDDVSIVATTALASANGTMVSTVTTNGILSSSIASIVTLTHSLVPNGTVSPSLGPNGTVVSTANPKSTTTQIPVCRPKCGHRNYIAHPWYCNKFFLCSGLNPVAMEMTCPGGLHFAIARERCDYPYIAECISGPDMPCTHFERPPYLPPSQ